MKQQNLTLVVKDFFYNCLIFYNDSMDDQDGKDWDLGKVGKVIVSKFAIFSCCFWGKGCLNDIFNMLTIVLRAGQNRCILTISLNAISIRDTKQHLWPNVPWMIS